MKVAIYSDEGASREGISILSQRMRDLHFSLISSQEILKGKLSLFTLLIFPGGRDLPYHEKLKGEGTQIIREFIEKGGRYLGICAGAYFASQEIEFDLGHPLEVKGARELAFFPGKASGPAYGKGSFSYESLKGARSSLLSAPSLFPTPFFCYHNGGCYFENAEEKDNTHILARYEDVKGRPAAIIECKVGKGRAILTGVHAEYSARHLSEKDPYIQKILKNLQLGEKEDLFSKLIQRLS